MLLAFLCLALLAIPPKVECSPHHVKTIYICSALVLSTLCPHVQLCRPAISVSVVPSSSFLSFIAKSFFVRLLSTLLALCPPISTWHFEGEFGLLKVNFILKYLKTNHFLAFETHKPCFP